MKQILQNLGSGETILAELPIPQVHSGHLLIQSQRSLVSLGTEKILVDFGKANLIDKARKQPEKVKQVLQKIKTDGLIPTVQAVKSKLDQPIPLGYCNSGYILEVGNNTNGFEIGDRVLTNGPHAEFVCVAKNLAAKIPDGVTFDEAAFAVPSSIGLQGIRLLQPTIGETFVVTGLGLIGLLATQILIANGCRVLGIDFDTEKCQLAQQFGAETVDLSKGENALLASETMTNGRGVDGVLITASTKSSEPVSHAAQMCRKRGRIVLVGMIGLELNRADFYEKEISFQVSCSYGPGRYDDSFESKGNDYPFGYVRWTEQRNFEASLQLLASNKLDVKSLISHKFKIADALEGYEIVSGGKALGIILEYPPANSGEKNTEFSKSVKLNQSNIPINYPPQKPVIGLIGAGNFTGQVLLPALQKTGAVLKTIVSGTGVSGTHLGKKFGFQNSTTDAQTVFVDDEINTIVVTTRHNTHAKYVIDALNSGKNVFVEKPLCLTIEELDEIKSAYRNITKSTDSPPRLMVGFNRRFSPHINKIQEVIGNLSSQKSIVMTINAGMIPADHWNHDRQIGGGRILGEGCHFIDLARYLAGSEISDSHITYLSGSGNNLKDTAFIQLEFENGSHASIQYLANGHKSFPKERVDIFCGGRIMHLDNFRTLTGFGCSKFNKFKTKQMDKGHNEELLQFCNAIENGDPSPINCKEILEVSRTTIELANKN